MTPGTTLPASSASTARPYTPSAVPFPLLLQRRARQSVRAHLLRNALRVSVLLAADAATVLLLRQALRVVRDGAVLGGALATGAGTLMPRGSFPTGQLVAAMMLGLLVTGNYAPGDRRRDAASLLAGSSLGLGLLFWGRFWADPSVLAVVAFGLTTIGTGAALALTRHFVDAIVRRVRPVSSHAARALVVGTRDAAQRALANPALRDGAEFAPAGFLDVSPVRAPDALGGADDLIGAIAQFEIDTVILAGHLDDDLYARIVNTADAAGCHVLSLSRPAAPGGLEPQLVLRRGVPFVELTSPGFRGWQLLLKRALDVVGAGLGLLVLSPLLLAIAAAVKLTSRGPVLFRQIRVGIGGRRFQIYKFRSMVRDAEARRGEIEQRSMYGDSRLFKVASDPRVTPVGAFLRRTSLDELPQLWNVFRGDMSLVGPRPPLPSEVALYEEHHYTRFDMRPGITGPWQTSGRNRITDFEEVVLLETAYLRHWTIWKDIAILLRTVPAVLRMDGAH